MRNIFSFFKSIPVFVFLLPVFFVFHGFTDNYFAVPVKDASALLLTYFVTALFFFSIGWFIYRQPFKAAIFSFCVMFFHFFFGAMQDLLKALFDEYLVTRYIFLLPFSFALFMCFIWFLKKTKKQLIRFGFYLNVLLCILIVIDVTKLAEKITQHNSRNNKNQYSIKCDSCIKPDIYFLVFDEYSSTTALKESCNYDNSGLDSFLTGKGFKVLPYSRSNYNFTEFSIASTLNMDHLKIPDPLACTVKDYNNCSELIKMNNVCEILNSMDYNIINYSIFDLSKNPTPVKEEFLPLKTKLITSQTFLNRIKKDLYYHLVVGKFEIELLSQNLIYATYHTNKKVIEGTLKETAEHSNNPKFLYAHIEMPHPPFYYNKHGQEKTKEEIVQDTREMKMSSYLDYLPKTNEVIKEMVNTIFLNSRKPFAIILMGDHGYRENQDQKFQFRNLNAVFLSSRNYSGFYDSITNVNEFRVLFNNLFHASLVLKKDSTVHLKDK